MKDTGIVRRVDELGRVVIPKELRRSLKIRTGEQLEIYTTDKRELVLKKYSQMESQFENVQELCSALGANTNTKVLVCDNSRILAVYGLRDDIAGEELSNSLYERLELRKSERGPKQTIRLTGFFEVEGYCYFSPIVALGDLYGAIVMIGDKPFRDSDIQKCEIMTSLLIYSLS